MGRLRTLLPSLTVAVAAAAALSACGSGESADLLPGRTASEISSNLDQVKQRVSEGDCVGAEDAVAAVRTEISDLGGVDRKLKANLSEGADVLDEVVAECEEPEVDETEAPAEPAVEEEVEKKKKKPEKEKPEKEPKEAEEEATPEPAEGGEGPSLPPQSNGKGDEKGQGGPAQVEPEAEAPPSSSGGVGPGVGVE